MQIERVLLKKCPHNSRPCTKRREAIEKHCLWCCLKLLVFMVLLVIYVLILWK